MPSQDSNLPKKPDLTVRIGERIIDCSGVLPFRLIDWRKLREKGIDPLRMSSAAAKGDLSMEPMEHIAIYAIQRAAPDVTEEQILESVSTLTCQRIAGAALAGEERGEIDRPTSTSFSTSPSGGDGGQAISAS